MEIPKKEILNKLFLTRNISRVNFSQTKLKYLNAVFFRQLSVVADGVVAVVVAAAVAVAAVGAVAVAVVAAAVAVVADVAVDVAVAVVADVPFLAGGHFFKL